VNSVGERREAAGASRFETMENPPLSRATLAAALDVYKTAWERQDAELILSIFTEEAVYLERVASSDHLHPAPHLHRWLNRDRRVGRYFDDRGQRQRKHMKEVAILEFVAGKIASLREYWASEVTEHVLP
jgi:hypothetical protein